MSNYQHLGDPFLTSLSRHERDEIEARRQAWGISSQDFYPRLEGWFANFDEANKPLALKILLNIQYFNPEQFELRIHQLRAPVAQFLHETGGEIRDILLVVPEERGDSADYHAYEVIKKWGLEQRQTVRIGELAAIANENSVLVFFNDTHGTGNQFLRELFAKIPQGRFKAIFVISITIAEKALRRFKVELPNVQVVPGRAPPSAMDIFTATELRRIRELGAKVYPTHPLGYGDAALLTAYYFQCPNNTLPLIWADGKNNAVDGVSFPWSPLFPYNPKVKPSKPTSRHAPPAPPDSALLDERCEWKWTPQQREEIRLHIETWGLTSTEFYQRAGDWFANFKEEEQQLSLDIFLATRYLDIRKVRRGINWLRDQILIDIRNAGGDIRDVMLVTTGDERNSVYHYLFEFLREWRLEVDQVCNIRRLTPDKVIDKTLVFFYHTRPGGNHFFKTQPDGLNYAEAIKNSNARAAFIAAYAMTPVAHALFEKEFPGRSIFLKEESKTLAQLCPQHLEALSAISAVLRPEGRPLVASEELLLAYYFQCPEASSPLLWAERPGKDGSRRWKPLFRHIQIPA